MTNLYCTELTITYLATFCKSVESFKYLVKKNFTFCLSQFCFLRMRKCIVDGLLTVIITTAKNIISERYVCKYSNVCLWKIDRLVRFFHFLMFIFPKV